MIGREERIAKIKARTIDPGDVVLEARAIATDVGHRDISFQLRRGEILGLYGLVGAGRSELVKALVGGGVTGGELTVRGKPARIRDMHEALGTWRIGYVSEDRKGEGLILIHSVRENVAITIWQRIAGFLGLIPPGRETRAVQPYVERLEVRTPSLAQAVGNLSGGNQQKVSMAKWLAANADILIIDEPTVGIDIKTKTYLHELIGEIAAGGVSVLLISSDMPEMVAVADRILVVHGFRIVGEVENDHSYEPMSQAIMGRIHAVEDDAA
jgi:ribose transport system ATP-binding protein